LLARRYLPRQRPVGPVWRWPGPGVYRLQPVEVEFSWVQLFWRDF
jgi:hypothetical protein